MYCLSLARVHSRLIIHRVLTASHIIIIVTPRPDTLTLRWPEVKSTRTRSNTVQFREEIVHLQLLELVISLLLSASWSWWRNSAKRLRNALTSATRIQEALDLHKRGGSRPTSHECCNRMNLVTVIVVGTGSLLLNHHSDAATDSGHQGKIIIKGGAPK